MPPIAEAEPIRRESDCQVNTVCQKAAAKLIWQLFLFAEKKSEKPLSAPVCLRQKTAPGKTSAGVYNPNAHS
ncbi:hypothetical protein [Brevibacillus gelatini]|uniref:Uncharacterized protein n=1 Tax=Brevibacillus gelatini TaxID=1655277 RepID=A0A3M8BDF2_9BACL|nr:hypothetical protein [Brevibacillus gelatini]RNB61322.1 hypothetical protein EDM57_01550 [Brevibacillus gelatini]